MNVDTCLQKIHESFQEKLLQIRFSMCFASSMLAATVSMSRVSPPWWGVQLSVVPYCTLTGVVIESQLVHSYGLGDLIGYIML